MLTMPSSRCGKWHVVEYDDIVVHKSYESDIIHNDNDILLIYVFILANENKYIRYTMLC